MQTITVAGKLGRDATVATTQGGDKVCNFTVAVDTYVNREKGTQWWRVSLWGKRGDSLAPYLLKGTAVTVSGAFEMSEYEGKSQLNIRANEVTLQGGKPSQRQETGGGGSGWGNGSDDLDDDVPFITMNSDW